MSNGRDEESAGNILIVDDDAENLRLLAKILQDQGYVVRPVLNGSLALEAVAAERPDLVLLDIRMPEMGGYEVCRRMKADERNRAIPIIFLSGLTNTLDKVQAFQLGAVDYIEKPFVEVEILARVSIHLKVGSFQKKLRRLNESLERRVEERTQQLRESEALFRAFVDNIPLEMIIRDTDGHFLFVNPAWEKITGRTNEQLIGKHVDEVYTKEAADIFTAQDRTVFETGQVFDQEVEVPPIPGRKVMSDQIALHLIKFPIRDAHGNITKIGVISIDITAQKQAEEQLRQAQKMEAVGQLTAGVAHDFNNMLAVISGNAELLGDELGKENLQLTALFRATKRAADLTQRLLAFSRKQMLSPEIVNANNLITDITGLLHRTLEEHIDIETVTGAGLWNCEVDPAQLENALVNLAVNARDAMPDGGKLTIETANARLDDHYVAAQAEVTPGQYVMLAVTDTGFGMPPDVREHVFEPFFTTKEVGAGSGLGLSMVYGFVKQSGGHVTIYSEVGEGTTIKLYLPRSAETTAAERKPVTDEAPAARGETVLVVEDDPDVRALAVALLSSLGYQIMEAGTAAAALELLDSTTGIDLLLTDVVLPGGMNGRELAVEFERRLPGIKILYMSGYTENAIVHHGRLDAGAELLQKPFRRADLARAVRRALDR